MEFETRVRKSPFVRYFDKTPPGIVCPHFFILAHGNGCGYRCAYCYLQLTFRGEVRPVVFTNREAMLAEVRRFLARPEPAALNAGELADALAFDDATRLTADLVPLFAAQDRHLLVLLTKSANVDGLLPLAHNRRTVVSFSVNAPEVAARYEPGAPPPEERIAAGARVAAAGYPLRFRIDPLIPVPGWEEMYGRLVERILAVAPPERITLGSLRYFRNVPVYARKLGRDASVFDYGTEPSPEDGRRRVPLELRLRMYRRLADLLPAGVEVGLCKETESCHSAFPLPRVVCNCTP
jgi:spore photoproduct lyase